MGYIRGVNKDDKGSSGVAYLIDFSQSGFSGSRIVARPMMRLAAIFWIW